MTSQQTRLWFYPDNVDLLVSAGGDLLAMRNLRLTAASERLADTNWGSDRSPEAPWTRETIEAINRDYDGLAKAFPELADLDEVARLLGLFAWLKEARAGGLKVPDLDELLNAELPAAPTPRTFPHLLCRAKMPSAGSSDLLEVLDSSAVGAAIERLLPVSVRPFAGPRRLERALAVLDRRVAEQDQLAFF